MRKPMIRALPLLALVCATPAIAGDGALQCKDQAEQILSRLQGEVVGKLDTADVAAANRIILDVCQDREVQAGIQMDQAVQEAREAEKAEADAWWLTESADKPGNKRLKRKSH